MAAPDREEIDALAGEYVLGTLDADERRAAEARYTTDAEFRRAVSEWEARLQPLADAAGESAVPDRVLGAIEARIGAAPTAAGDNVIALRRQVRRWRITSAIVGAAAAVLAGVVVVDVLRPPQTEFVAVLTAEGAEPAFVATVDVARGTLSLRRIVPPPPEDRSYEIWAVEPGTVPVSLGVIDDDANVLRAIEQSPQDLVLAISLEPRGGSPTGVATGPIVFSGPLISPD